MYKVLNIIKVVSIRRCTKINFKENEKYELNFILVYLLMTNFFALPKNIINITNFSKRNMIQHVPLFLEVWI